MPEGVSAAGLRFLLAALATWRVTHLLVEEDGPGDIVVRARVWAGEGFIGRAMDCFYCLSLWVAAPFALVVGRDVLSWGLAWLAVSGAACLLERVNGHSEGDARELLRKETDGAAGTDAPTVALGGAVAADTGESDDARLSR